MSVNRHYATGRSLLKPAPWIEIHGYAWVCRYATSGGTPQPHSGIEIPRSLNRRYATGLPLLEPAPWIEIHGYAWDCRYATSGGTLKQSKHPTLNVAQYPKRTGCRRPLANAEILLRASRLRRVVLALL